MAYRQSWSEWFPETEAEYRERVARSIRMTAEERFAEGFRLFEKECAMRKEAIRSQHPDMTDEEVERAFTAQTEARRAIEDERIYVHVYGPWPENS